MQNEPIKEGTINTQLPSEVLQQGIKKKKNWLPIIIIISIFVLLFIVFNESEFVAIFGVISIPFIIIYIALRNTHKEISSHKMITRPTFWLLLFILDVVTLFIILVLLTPKNGNLGLAVFPITAFVIIGEIIFNILAIIIYELILKHKIRTGKINNL